MPELNFLITISEPSEGTTLTTPTLDVRGTAWAYWADEPGGGPHVDIDSVVVQIDGQAVQADLYHSRQEVEWSCAAHVTESGEITIRATATAYWEGRRVGDSIERTFTVELVPPPEPPTEFPAWLRLEPRSRSNDFARGLEARTADPLWMLARQWQMGEFQGEDAGSPLKVHLTHSTQPPDRVRLGETGQPSNLASEPLETIVEREWTELDWRTRVQVGQQFERLLRAELGSDDPALPQDAIEAYRAHYSLDLPPEPPPPVWQMKVTHRPGMRIIAGSFPTTGIELTVTDPWGNATTTVSGDKPEYGIGGFEVLADQVTTYTLAFLGETFEVQTHDGATIVTFTQIAPEPPEPPEEGWVQTDRATRRFLQFMDGRVTDGQKLLNDENEHKVPALGGITPEQLDNIVGALRGWCQALNTRPSARKPDAWRAQQLDYRFETNPPEYTRSTFLFDVGLEYEDDLDQGVLSEGLRQEFESHGIALPDEVTITTKVEGSQWWITHVDLTYIVRREGGVLRIYQPGKTRLVAPNYQNGDLDWYTFDAAGGLQPDWTAQDSIKTHPTRITVGGTSPRWWAFEDAATDFGRLDVAKPDLAKLAIIEFVLIYGDDWFCVPLPLQMPNLVRIKELRVFNVFGQDTVVKPARKVVRDELVKAGGDPDDPDLRWEMFTLSPLPDPNQPGVGDPNLPGVGVGLSSETDVVDVLFLPPVAGFREESSPLEEIRFLRDEGANMVWAVEHTVQSGLGRPVDGFDAQRERIERVREADMAWLVARLAEIEEKLAAGDLDDAKREELEAEAEEKREELARLQEGPRPTGSGAPRYRLATLVPENWIPFIPANATAYLGYPGLRLLRAQMLRNTDDEEPCPIPAMSHLLELEGEPLLWLEEATVPRSGLRVQLTAQRVRWVDGKTYMWLGRKVLTGRGEGSSGLRFDVVR